MRGQQGHELNMTSGGGSRGAEQRGAGQLRDCVQVHSVRGGTKSQVSLQFYVQVSSTAKPQVESDSSHCNVNPLTTFNAEPLPNS